MKKKKLIFPIIIVFLLVIDIFSFSSSFSKYDETVQFKFSMNTDFNKQISVSYGDAENTLGTQIAETALGTYQEMMFTLPSSTQWINIYFSEESTSTSTITEPMLTKLWTSENLNYTLTGSDNVLLTENQSQSVVAAVQGTDDPYISFVLEPDQIPSFLQNSHKKNQLKLCGIILLSNATVLVGVLIVLKSSIFRTLFKNKRLIISLAKNDFKTKYSGSVFGAFWAFVQPMVTIGIYVFVFQIGFKAAPAGQYPFILWLVPGIIPWFFFAEAILSITSSLIEYSYLVKKVVFDIATLPVVKIISSLFVHLFFILIAVVLFLAMGYPLTLYAIQVLYYLIAVVALIFSLSYLVASITPFFKDFSQIVNILIQIGMWMTPIMWNIDVIPVKYQFIFKLNPMYYIVEGYRDAYLGRAWFWDKPFQSIYFWIVVLILFCISSKLFSRLKNHFSDVL